MLRVPECLLQILRQIVGVLDTNGQPNQLVGDTNLQAFLTGQFEMRHATWQFRQAFDGSQGNRQTEQLQVIQHVSGIDTVNDFETQDAATAALVELFAPNCTRLARWQWLDTGCGCKVRRQTPDSVTTAPDGPDIRASLAAALTGEDAPC